MNNNTKIDKNEWYRFNDGFFTYYINNKLELDISIISYMDMDNYININVYNLLYIIY